MLVSLTANGLCIPLIYSVLITCKHTIPPSYKKKILAYRSDSSIPRKHIQSGPVLHQIGCESSLDGRNPMTQDAFLPQHQLPQHRPQTLTWKAALNFSAFGP
jgi:hypothetical protein